MSAMGYICKCIKQKTNGTSNLLVRIVLSSEEPVYLCTSNTCDTILAFKFQFILMKTAFLHPLVSRAVVRWQVSAFCKLLAYKHSNKMDQILLSLQNNDSSHCSSMSTLIHCAAELSHPMYT